MYICLCTLILLCSCTDFPCLQRRSLLLARPRRHGFDNLILEYASYLVIRASHPDYPQKAASGFLHSPDEGAVVPISLLRDLYLSSMWARWPIAGFVVTSYRLLTLPADRQRVFSLPTDRQGDSEPHNNHKKQSRHVCSLRRSAQD